LRGFYNGGSKMHHSLTAALFVGVATALAIVCSFGLAIVKKPLERLHFSATVTSITVALITLAVWLDDPTWQSRIKVTLIAVILFFMNSILSHATARAIRIFENDQLEPRGDETVLRISKENPSGSRE
jgi:multisubunit Na+/H+ antiporter MnhG subunit